MTWEAIEQAGTGQLDFPAMTTLPTVAERAFLVLAREWITEYETQTDPKRLTSHMGDLSLSCLLLAVEWGKTFTSVAHDQMEINRLVAARHCAVSWMNQLPWKLCQASSHMFPAKSVAVDELTANLDHHNSSIRFWIMEIAWFAVPWLNPLEASAKLLKNLADTLEGPFLAAGLAARLFEKEESFMAFARDFTPRLPPDEDTPDDRRANTFQRQYQDRLQVVVSNGIPAMQAPFWQTETMCRHAIDKACLGKRMLNRTGSKQ